MAKKTKKNKTDEIQPATAVAKPKKGQKRKTSKGK